MKKSPCFDRLLAYAAYDCAQRGKRLVNSDHLLLGLYREDFPLVDEVMCSLDVDAFYALGRLLKFNPESERPYDIRNVRFGNEAMEILTLANMEVRRFQHEAITAAHVFMALLSFNNSFLFRFLTERKVEPQKARAMISAIRFDGDMPLETVELKRDKETYLSINFLDVGGFFPEDLGVTTLKLIKKL